MSNIILTRDLNFKIIDCQNLMETENGGTIE